MLKLQLRHSPEHYTRLASSIVTIGRDPKNQMSLNDPSVSDFHAEISLEGGELHIVDLLSNSGTFVNGVPVKGRHPLQAWDVIRVGTVELEINDPNKRRPDEWALCTVSDLLAGQHFTLKAKTTVGREPGCDIAILSEHLSRRHAELYIEGERLRIVDLQSRNGTFLNGTRITEAYADAGDELRFDRLAFIVAGPVSRQPKVNSADEELTKVRSEAMGETELHAEMDTTQSTADDETLIADIEPRFKVFLIARDKLSGVPSKLLIAGETLTLGRSPENDVVLSDRGISKQHLQLVGSGNEWKLEDRGSRNGVILNGRRITGAESLTDGDLIRVGDHEFQFSIEQNATNELGGLADRTMVFSSAMVENRGRDPGRSRRRTSHSHKASVPAWCWGALILFCLAAAVAALLFRRKFGF